jgi:hypothetical protein
MQTLDISQAWGGVLVESHDESHDGPDYTVQSFLLVTRAPHAEALKRGFRGGENERRAKKGSGCWQEKVVAWDMTPKQLGRIARYRGSFQ